jgi:hypothetical protein
MKKAFFVVCFAFLFIPAMLFGQSADSYLQETSAVAVIRALSQEPSRELKLLSLEYINAAIQRGNTGDSIREVLEFLALEGNNGKTRPSYPLVRRKAAEYLGVIGGNMARDSLLKVLHNEVDSLVMAEALNSLSKIALDDGGFTVNSITAAIDRLQNTGYYDNTTAMATLKALSILGQTQKNNAAMVWLIMDIYQSPYYRDDVHQAAEQVLEAFSY